MGAWKHNRSPKYFVDVERIDENVTNVSAPQRKRPTVLDDECYSLQRTYYVNASDSEVRKIISTLRDYKNRELPYILIQYLFKFDEHEVSNVKPHGNSKDRVSYRRLLPSTREKIKSSVNNKSKSTKNILDEVYRAPGDVTEARSLGELPRGPKDIYNARIGTSSRKENCADALGGIFSLLERAKREETCSTDSKFIRECTIHPDFLVVLATDRQLQEVSQFCTDPSELCVFQVDPTFNVFEDNISLTVTTYRNMKLLQKETDKSPVVIGPLLVHQRKHWKAYSKFSNVLTTEKPELEGLLACGTDGERALIDGFQRNFRFSLFLRCFLHFKDNIKRELHDRGMSGSICDEFIQEIFGKQEGEVKYYGLVDCDSEDEFDLKLDRLQEKWQERERKHGHTLSGTVSFYEWFKENKVNDMKVSMLKSIRTEAGLGDPPADYTNNDVESANFMIKYGLSFDPRKPHDFINCIKQIIDTQFRNEDRAVFGIGPFKVRDDFKHLTVNNKWGKLTHQQRRMKLSVFEKTGMDGRKCQLEKVDGENHASTSAARLSSTASESGITTVPMPILDTMFSKANDLLSTPGSVIPKPGANNGSFIVAGSSNNIHCVTPGKGASLSCDRTCVNSSTKICEHILAVAQVRGTLKEFLGWYKRTKKGPNVMGMVLGTAPKTMGRKPSKRKRTNNEKPPVTSMVDLLDETEDVGSASTIPTNVTYAATSFSGMQAYNFSPMAAGVANYSFQPHSPHSQ